MGRGRGANDRENGATGCIPDLKGRTSAHAKYAKNWRLLRVKSGTSIAENKVLSQGPLR
jgi:hypothetical protein